MAVLHGAALGPGVPTELVAESLAGRRSPLLATPRNKPPFKMHWMWGGRRGPEQLEKAGRCSHHLMDTFLRHRAFHLCRKIHSKAEGRWGLASWKPQLDRPVDRLTPNGMSEGLSGLVLQSFPNSLVPSTHFPVLLFLAWLFVSFLLQDPWQKAGDPPPFHWHGAGLGVRPSGLWLGCGAHFQLGHSTFASVSEPWMGGAFASGCSVVFFSLTH